MVRTAWASARAVPFVLSLALAAPVLLAPPPAAAQSVDALRQDLERMRRDIADLQRSVYRGEAPPASASGSSLPGAEGDMPASVASRLQLRSQQFEGDLRTLNGRIEELEFAMRQMTERFDRFSADLDLRLRAIETGTAPGQPDSLASAAPGQGDNTTVITSRGASGPGAAPAGSTDGLAPGVQPLGALPQRALDAPAQPAAPPPSATASVAPPPAGAGPQEEYDYATRLLFARDYAGAETALSDFLVKHPDHSLAGNAYYWLAETHYVRNDFAKAATLFLDAYQKFPQGNKAPDSLLKLALSLGQVGETQAACAALGELAGNFPDAAVPIQRRAAQERQTRQCPS